VSPQLEVHNARRVNHEVLEDTGDWFARDEDGNVRYFGENTAILSGILPVRPVRYLDGWVDCAAPAITI
jgi:hypothetical protein